jgi:hypothetical protein
MASSEEKKFRREIEKLKAKLESIREFVSSFNKKK